MKEIELKEGQKLYGYAGKILRINLTDSTTDVIPSSKYVPKYIGGWTVANAIFWEDIKETVPALSAENEIIYMLGPGAGSGLPIMGRAEMCGVAANNIPESYTHSSIGGPFGPMLKWAGYDGFVITGKAPKHTYVLIEDDKVSFLDADEAGLWGQLVHESQERIFDLYGRDTFSLVIGPAGENQHRNASITTGNDHVSAKAGFGAVWGYKNLKAVAVRGTGTIQPAIGLEDLLKLRLEIGNPGMRPNPLKKDYKFVSFPSNHFRCEEEWACYESRLACSHGCNRLCVWTCFEIHDPFNPGRKVTEGVKCMERWAANWTYDCSWQGGAYVHSHRQEVPGHYNWCAFLSTADENDPDRPFLLNEYMGDRYDMLEPNMERGQTITWLCTQYGLDKWEMVFWYIGWLSMCKKEGLLEGIDFGREVDVNDPEFIKYFITMMTYRNGPMIKLPDGTERPIGDLFAEGMGRVTRALGEEKYRYSIYHGRTNAMGEHLDIPVSWEASWGVCTHWLGRGFQGCPKPQWLIYAVDQMLDSRDSQGNSHFHMWIEDYLKTVDDPAHSKITAEFSAENRRWATMKDTLVSCEYCTPDPGRPDQEVQLFKAATGIDVTLDQLMDVCEKSRLIYRAILMRNAGRTRDLEVENCYYWLTYPDPWGKIVTWDEWNDLVDLVYEVNGFDKATGWPFRSTWEKYGLKDIADEMEARGMLPPEGGTPGYTRKANPFDR